MKSGKILTGIFAGLISCASGSLAQSPSAQSQNRKPATRTAGAPASIARPKLVVLLVVDQMRGDYVDKFQGQWTGGLKRLVNEGAWFREAAYHYSETETC